MSVSQNLKSDLVKECQSILDQKIELLEKQLADFKKAANNETKSSVGDKYETGRAMMHNEMDKLKQQQAQAITAKAAFMQIQFNNKASKIQLGSLVKTDKGTFLLAVALGKVVVQNQHYFVLSLASPIGQKLKGKKQGDSITLNNQCFTVLKIE